jgi:hypothetical protein
MEKKMKDPAEKSDKEALRLEKLKAEEAKSLAREQVRKNEYLAHEQKIEKAQNIKDVRRAEQRAGQEIKELAEEKSRKEVYQAREKIIAEDQETRKQKNKNTNST